jgi:peptidoglycan-associated lipoprotein
MTFVPDSRFGRTLLWGLLLLTVALSVTACRRYPNCRKDKHCLKYIERGIGTESHCVNRICRECISDAECGRGRQCVSNSCRDIAGYCDDETPCPPPQVCRDNRCGPQCLSDSDCASLGQFYYCQGGTCIEGECNTDADCPDGHRCQNHRCVAPPVAQVPCGNGTFRTVLFDFDESAIRADQRSNMEWNLACFSQRADNVTIEGHCDERGTDEYNIALGNRRATTVRNYLRDQGVAQTRLRTVSYGESRPASRGSNESAWAQNRRAEFVWGN